jgi:ferredoxin
MSKRWKITIDRDLCIGAASCVALAMKTFELDGENKAVVLEGEGDPPDLIKLAAESCPTKAIILTDDTGKQEYP